MIINKIFASLKLLTKTIKIKSRTNLEKESKTISIKPLNKELMRVRKTM